MKTPVIAVAGVAAATVLVGLSMTGCSSKSDKPAATSSSASATAKSSASSEPSMSETASGGYAKLLIKPEDIALPGDTFSVAPPTENPNGKSGVAAVFSNQGDTREIGDTILILPRFGRCRYRVGWRQVVTRQRGQAEETRNRPPSAKVERSCRAPHRMARSR